MAQPFENLRELGNQSKLRAFVQDSSVEELVRIVRNSICKPDAVKILDDLLQAFSDSDHVCQQKRRKLIESTINSLEKAKISTGQANAIVNRIISDLPRYSKEHLVKLVDFCLTNIHRDDHELHSWKDLLPVLLEALENEKYVLYADAQVSGTEYKSDITLNKLDHNQLVQTLCSNLPRLPLDRVPSFVYQTLKLCKDRDNRKLFSALSKYFHCYYSKATSLDDKDSSIEDIGTLNIKEVQDIESTVLYHVYQAAQLNHENMRDFIRFLKHVSYASEYMLQPFMLAVLMSVSSIYEDQIFEALRMAIVNSNSEKGKQQTSAWLRQLLPSSCNIIRIIRQVIDSSNKDRHLVLKGLTSLAFMLMSADQKLKGNTTTAMWCTGSEIVREVIKKRHETVPIVLQELINKIVAGGMTTTHYTDCLKYMCRELSMIVLDHQVWIMTLLERLLFFPSIVANQVLFAIFPLMHVSSNIRENLLLTLRKALYRKGISKRQMAVTGFLEMLKYSKMHSLASFRLSQRCNSSEHAISSSSRSTLTQVTLEYNSQREKSITRLERDKTLCYEILDILKKSFTYEFQVRLHLYEGLHDTISKNSEITEILLDMLLSHFNLYFHTDDDILPPVRFELCTDIRGTEIVLQEPIAQLIFTLQKIYIDTIPRNSNTFETLYSILESLCRRMPATDFEHFNLDHGTDLLHGDFPKSHIKLKHLGMAIEVYEALIAFQIGKCSKGNEESSYKINDLFKGYTRFTNFIKMQSTKVKKIDSGNSKKDGNLNNTTKKIVKSNSVKLPNTIMNLDIISQSLTLLYSQSSSSQNRTMLRENHNFCRYILQTSEQLLQRARSHSTDVPDMRNIRYISTYIEVGRLLYKYFVLNLNDALANDEQVTILALQCFKEISSCMCTLFSSELPRFLNAILQTENDSISVDINSQLQEIIFSLKPSLMASLVEETDDNERKKIPFLLLQIMEQFAYKINFETYNPEKILKCTRKMIQTENIQSPIVPALIQFFLNLEEHTREYGETLNEICLELCEKVGSIDGTEIASNQQYKVIREDTVLQIYNVLNGHIKEKLNNTCWLLMRLKAEDTISRTSGTVDDVWNNNLREKERNLCKQLSHVAQVLHTLANMSVKPGLCTDVTFKNLQYLYHLLGNLTKYFYAKSNDQNVAFQAVKFIQVVQLAGKPLKSAFYNLVTYVEENQNKLHSKCDSYAQRNKILKETKVIPRVVYEIEQFNKEILLLGKRTGVPLENYMKHSVTRDFRIKNPQLVEGLEKMDVSLLTASSNLENTENEMDNLNVDDESKSSSSGDDALPLRKRLRIEEN
ncbi:Fanconi anemia group I protein like protein [Habropoda laboriosa]|uniref:Fanconi anemia group I protein like protein n=1 Tax=Habropoda laboriosa TaxID=597456 RepID=A0A0L7QKH3_9HYME|nr:Fanconi anemia group I protein like protein [Habropoda laboriosa]